MKTANILISVFFTAKFFISGFCNAEILTSAKHHQFKILERYNLPLSQNLEFRILEI